MREVLICLAIVLEVLSNFISAAANSKSTQFKRRIPTAASPKNGRLLMLSFCRRIKVLTLLAGKCE
jgi:hypothetical protein